VKTDKGSWTGIDDLSYPGENLTRSKSTVMFTVDRMMSVSGPYWLFFTTLDSDLSANLHPATGTVVLGILSLMGR
jgi:hypothetical protein